MVIIYGVRGYGRVRAHGGEHAETRFAHLWFAPLFPVGSRWVSPAGVEETRLDGKSVVAAYLRIWGVIVGVGLLASGGTVGALFGGALLALAGWAWTWRGLPGGVARRRSDFNLLAFGTRLPAARMTDEARELRERALAARWAARGATRPPEDVARFGTADVMEAALAYGQLALAAARRGRVAIAERLACERLVSGRYERLPDGVGPYRSERPEATPSVGAPSEDALSAAVAQAASRAVASRVPTPPGRPSFFARRAVQAALLAAFTTVPLVMLPEARRELAGPTVIGARELGAATPPRGVVTITVDRIEDRGWAIVDQHGAVTERIVLGWIGQHVVPIKWAADGALPGRTISGRLRDAANRRDLVVQALNQEPELEAASYEWYVDGTAAGQGGIAVMIVFALAIAAGWCWHLRHWRRVGRATRS
jgi:hypothetical protein